MFRVGELVTGNANNDYGFTNEYSLNLVLRVGLDEMTVITMESSCFPYSMTSMSEEKFTNIITNIFTSDFDTTHIGRNDICAYDVDINKFKHISLSEYEIYKQGRLTRKSIFYDYILKFVSKEGEKKTDMIRSADPVLHTNGTYSFTNKQKEYITTNMAKVLTEYEHTNSPKGIKEIWDTYCPNKEGVASILSKHPNWIEDAMAVVLEGSYRKTADTRQINQFADWCKTQLDKWVSERPYKYHCCTVNELKQAFARMKDLTYYVDKIHGMSNVCHSIIVNGMNFDELMKERERVKELFDHAYTNSFEIYTSEERIYVNKETYIKFMNGIAFINLIKSTTVNTADEDFATQVNKLAEPFNFIDKRGKVKGFGAVAGQKISRIVGKFFKNYGFDKITDYHSETHIDEQGVVHEGVKRDYGWNREYALYCDAINVLDFKRWTIISVNPLDYLTMSFGHKWQSCHTIDKRNIRDVDSSHVYHGMYCSGTMSYMLDSASVIMYTIDEKYKGTEYWKQDKFNRCMFHIGEDKFVQGRLYPDGRDGGDNSLSTQFRNIFQKVISECIEEPNMWKLVKGTDKCSIITDSYGTHYRDYLNYSDCSVSYLKRNGIAFNETKIKIGHNPICPNCGKEHEECQSLTCNDCPTMGNVCHYCGDELDEYDYIVDEDTGHTYCCYDCANSDDVYYCDNVGEWHSENVYWENYCGEYFYATNDMVAVEGRYETFYYMDSENAESDGWHYIESENEWFNEDSSRNPHFEEIEQCYECCEWFMKDEMKTDINGEWHCETCADNNPERFESEDDDLIDESDEVA